jgi:probable phosphoglycerate mutase
MPAYPPIYILRHGQTEWNRVGRCQGHLNSNLTKTGRAQARDQGVLLGGIFAARPSAKVFCSPQGRTRETADIALENHDVSVHLDPRLTELGAGEWTGLNHAMIAQKWPALFNDNIPIFEASLNAVGGEGYTALRTRCRDFLADIDAPTIVITHGITGMVLRGLVCGLSFAEIAQLQFTQGCVFALMEGKEHILTR